MDHSQSIVELVAAARVGVLACEGRISEAAGDDGAQARQMATKEIEAAAVDIFTLFEARMQHHFKRGPFSRKLKALLLEAGEPDLANRVYQYYLAINVLKHGKGASYRELLDIRKPLFDVQQEGDVFIDVRAVGFFDGVCETILEACDFLENRGA